MAKIISWSVTDSRCAGKGGLASDRRTVGHQFARATELFEFRDDVVPIAAAGLLEASDALLNSQGLRLWKKVAIMDGLRIRQKRST